MRFIGLDIEWSNALTTDFVVPTWLYCAPFSRQAQMFRREPYNLDLQVCFKLSNMWSVWMQSEGAHSKQAIKMNTTVEDKSEVINLG